VKKILGISALILGLFVLAKKAKGQPQGENLSDKTPVNDTGNILITDHDTVWDYKRENGVWFTKKKSSTSWIDMKKALSDENYREAINRLNNYLAKKTRKITVVP